MPNKTRDKITALRLQEKAGFRSGLDYYPGKAVICSTEHSNSSCIVCQLVCGTISEKCLGICIIERVLLYQLILRVCLVVINLVSRHCVHMLHTPKLMCQSQEYSITKKKANNSGCLLLFCFFLSPNSRQSTRKMTLQERWVFLQLNFH